MKKQSKSVLPNGGYTLTNGSNYMLDGFQFDTEYNGGVLEKARLPEAKGLSALPYGMIPEDSPKASIMPSHVDEEGGIHLGDFIKESSQQYIPIVDHSWLAQETQANLEGVRNKKDVYEQMDSNFYEDSSLKELSEMWSESTNGLGLVPNKNREQKPTVNPYHHYQSVLPADDYREKIEKAMRRSAYSEPINIIIADLKKELGPKYKDEIGNRIANEHGLHGKVYIREEAFKGLFNGKWDKQIKARCASAKYIIPITTDCVFDYHQGRKVVSNINWKSAFEHYAPKLKTIGIKLGSGTNYQSRLKQAFLTQAPASIQPQTWFEYQEDLTKKYSTEEANSKFANYEPEVIDVGTTLDKEAKVLESKLNKLANQILSSGIVSEKEKVTKILNSKLSTDKKMDLLNRYASENVIAKKSNYDGQRWEVLNNLKTYQNDFRSLEKEISSRLKQASILPLSQKEKAMIEINQALENKITRLAQSNYIDSVELSNIVGNIKSPKDKLARVVNYLESQLIKVGSYNQTEFKENVKLSNKTANDSIKSQKELTKHTAKKNLENVQHLVNAGIIDKEQAYKLASQGKTPQDMYLSVLKGAQKLYDNAIYTANNLLSEPKNKFENFDDKNQRLSKLNQNAVDNKIAKLVQANMISQKEVNSIKHSNPNKKLALILEHISKNHIAGSKEYSDTQYTQHIETRKASVKLASKDTVEIWLKQKMSEGAMGKDLDVMLNTRFANEVLTHYSDMITKLRSAHEGLSGQVYVDASAYEKAGCDQGSLQHRANTIPAVMKMDKCSSCVFANAEGVCQKYNKPLIASVSELGIDNSKKYQKESIRLANSSDAEKTASLFVNEYDEDEFGLTTNDEIELESPNQAPDTLADVLFGGFEV